MPHAGNGNLTTPRPTRLPVETCTSCGQTLEAVYPTLVAAGARLSCVAPRAACPHGCESWEWAAVSGWTRLPRLETK